MKYKLPIFIILISLLIFFTAKSCRNITSNYNSQMGTHRIMLHRYDSNIFTINIDGILLKCKYSSNNSEVVIIDTRDCK